MPDITSRQHAVVQAFRTALQGESDLALLDGWHLLHDAAAARLDIRTVALSAAPQTPQDAELIQRLTQHCDVFTVTSAVMDAMSPVRTPSGVVALATRREHALTDLLQPHPALMIVAIDVQDPGNVGAIIRSAEAGGATGVLLAGAAADPWQWKALRAAMGSTFRLPVVRVGEPLPLDELKSAGLKLVATVPRGGKPLERADLRAPVALILGAEGRGLAEALLSKADEHLTIPMRTTVESLNVGVAAALLIDEARRQREA